MSNEELNVIGVSSDGHVKVYEIIHGIDDEVIFQFCNHNIETTTILYDDEGETYFNAGKLKYYFNEIERV